LLQREYHDALLYFAGRKHINKYRSVMDFLFCELHTEWRRACHKYYSGQGEPLRDLISPQQWLIFNKRMLIALDVARTLYIQEPYKYWSFFCRIAEDAIAT